MTWSKQRRTVGSAVVILLILALTGLAATGCGGSANAGSGALKLTEADNGKVFTVKVGDTIEIAIPGNPTTGYEWKAALDQASAAILEPVGDPIYTPESTDKTLVGGGGIYTFTFKAVKSGQATIKLTYARAFENVEPLQTFTATLTVK